MRIFRPSPSRAAALILAALIFAPSSARAGEPSPAEVKAARQLFRAAEAHEDRGEWREALEKLRSVAKVKLTAGIRFHLALCEEHLGEYEAALDDYAAAASQAEAEGAKDVSVAVGPRLKAVRALVVYLTVRLPNVPQVELRIDGAVVPEARTERPIVLRPGVHRIAASAPRRVPFQRVITVGGGATSDVKVDLLLPLPPNPPPPPDVAPPPSRTGAVLATAGTGILIAGGVLAYLQAGALATDRAREGGEDRIVPIRVWDAIALGSWIGAAGLGTLAFVLWSKTTDQSSPRPAHGSLVLGPGSVGLAGSF